MIKSLTINNFQSHKHSELIFHQGTNVIIGMSDSGKSAIIRAIKWLTQNRPQGDSFRSSWGGSTVVHIETDKDKIDRWKHNYENAYRLDIKTFEAFKTEVPQEIQDALNLTEINFQHQLDSPFLLSMSSGDVATYFNKVAKLDKIDTGLQNINSKIRELNQDIKYKGEQKDKLEEELKGFEFLDKFEIEVEVLEEMDKDLLVKESQIRKLSDLRNDLFLTEDDIEDASAILEAEEPLDAILDLYKQKKDIINKGIELKGHANFIIQIEDEIKEKEMLTTLENPVLELLSLYHEQNTLDLAISKLSKTLSELNDVNALLEDKTQEIASMEVIFEKEMGDVCLLCGQSIKH